MTKPMDPHTGHEDKITDVEWGDLPDDVEIVAEDAPNLEEREPPDLGELSDFLQETNREFEASDDYDDEPVVDVEGGEV
jgi:hypothetical protein